MIAKLRGKIQIFLYTPCLHTCIACPILNIPHQRSTFVTTDEPTLTHPNHPKSIAYIMVTLDVPNVFYDFTSEAAFYYFIGYSVWQRMTGGHEYQEAGILRGHLGC